MNPIDATPEEKQAAANPGTPAPVKPLPFALPKWLTTTAAIVATLSMPALALLSVVTVPGWVTLAVYLLGVVASLLAGMGLPSPFIGKPVLSGGVATVGGGVAVLLADFAAKLPEGDFSQRALMAGVLVLSALTGAALPTQAKRAA